MRKSIFKFCCLHFTMKNEWLSTMSGSDVNASDEGIDGQLCVGGASANLWRFDADVIAAVGANHRMVAIYVRHRGRRSISINKINILLRGYYYKNNLILLFSL